MKYTVRWYRPALNQYLAMWTAATDPDAVDAAANRIDRTLRVDAEQMGESRSGDERILFDPPLAVLFVADQSERIAYIASVGWSGRPV